MQKILEGSLLYRLIAVAAAWCGKHWRSSRIVNWFLSPRWSREASESSIFTRIWLGVHRFIFFIFEKLRLNKLLCGSIFAMPFIWCFIAVALAPLITTMMLLVISLACFGSLLLAFGCDRERKLAYSPSNKYILIFVLIYVAATLTSVSVAGSLRGGALTALFTLFPIVLQNSVKSRRQLDTLVYALVMSGVAVSLYGIYQYVFGAIGASAWVDSSMFSDIGVRVYSTLDNPNVLSMYLLLVIPFAGSCILNARGVVARLFFIGCLGVMIACMLFTFSRGGWLGLLIAAAIFLVMLDRRFILVGIAGLIVLYFALPEVILDRLLSVGNTGDSSTSFRVFIWLGTLNMLRDYWFTGIGPGVAAYKRVYPLYSYNAVYSPHSHNLYLQITCDTGFSGIAIFIVIFFTYFRDVCSALSRERDKASKRLQIAAVSSIFGFLAQGMTDYSFYNYRVMFVFWLVLGIGIIAARRSRLEGGAGGVPAGSDSVPAEGGAAASANNGSDSAPAEGGSIPAGSDSADALPQGAKL